MRSRPQPTKGELAVTQVQDHQATALADLTNQSSDDYRYIEIAKVGGSLGAIVSGIKIGGVLEFVITPRGGAFEGFRVAGARLVRNAVVVVDDDIDRRGIFVTATGAFVPG